jgi:glutathione-independent formaldehyde dehydrogenase
MLLTGTPTGPNQGWQARMCADSECLKVPGKPFDRWKEDFILLADLFATGYNGAELANVVPGKSVAGFWSRTSRIDGGLEFPY